MDNRQYNKGTEGNKGGGRKPKELNKQLIKKLTPMNPIALKSLKKALNGDKPWAIKLYFEYYYGRPQQRLDVTSGDEPMNVPVISYFET